MGTVLNDSFFMIQADYEAALTTGRISEDFYGEKITLA